MRAGLRRLRGLVVKESLQAVRDPSTILIAFFLPLALLFLYGYAVSLDASRTRIGLVLEDATPETRSLAAAFTFSRYFDVRLGRDRREFTEDLTAGRLRGVVVIPAWFSGFVASDGREAPIQVITDGSEPNTANFVQNYAQGVWQTWLAQRRLEQGQPRRVDRVELLPRVWYNEELVSRNFLVPGSVAMVLTLIGALLTALVVAREWERGTMEALMATPAGVWEILLSKLVPYFLLGMGSMTLCMLVAVFFFQVPFRGSYLALSLTSAVFLCSALGMGLLVSSLARNQFVAAQVSIMAAYLPAFLLSGFIFEISSMPPVIQAVTRLIPARYFVSSLQTLFLVGDVWTLLWPNIAWMLGLSSLLFIGSALKNAKRLD